MIVSSLLFSSLLLLLEVLRVIEEWFLYSSKSRNMRVFGTRRKHKSNLSVESNSRG